jgi:hypothetical protein
MNRVKVFSVTEFQATLSKINSACKDSMLVYRGQTKDRPMIPSARRQPKDEALAKAMPILNHVWESFVDSMLNELQKAALGKMHNRVAAGMALLQHYGFRSWFVDVSHKPQVALWFALHEFIPSAALVKSTDCYRGSSESPFLLDHAFAQVKTARYERTRTGSGFVYVLGLEPKYSQLLLDLRTCLPRSVLRVHRQAASGLLEPLDGRTIDSLVVAKMEVAATLNLAPDLNCEWLFPGPEKDKAYRMFLRVPYLAPENQIRARGSLARAVLEVPLYLYDSEPSMKSLRLSKIVLGSYAPHTWHTPENSERVSVQMPITPPGGPNPAFVPGKCVQEKSSSSAKTETLESSRSMPAESTGVKPDDLVAWPSRQLFLEFPFTSMIPVYLKRRSAYPIFRGLWIDWSPEAVRIQRVFEDLRYLRLEPGCHFHFDRGRYNLVREPGDCAADDDNRHLSYLTMFLFLTKRLRDSSAELRTVAKNHFHYYWLPLNREPWIQPFGEPWKT